ncbi:MAG: PKD domain-containing protein, partial [Thermoplasmata archaeon]|nr:PKD domain-containing protein [Thermoplasmata archaeon]
MTISLRRAGVLPAWGPRGRIQTVVLAIVVAGLMTLPVTSALPVRVAAPSGSVRLEAHPSAGLAHDLAVTSSSVTGMVGRPVPLLAFLPPLGSLTGPASWDFGDGSTGQSTVGSIAHTFAATGIYTVAASAVDSVGNLHDDLHSMFSIEILPTWSNDTLGNQLPLQGTIVANGTSTTDPTAALPPGGSVRVAVSAVYPLTDPRATVVGALLRLAERSRA